MANALQPRHFHFIASLALLVVVVCFQSLVLARSSSPWLHIDLVTIFVVYVAIEHYLFGAVIKVLVAAMSLHTFSAVPGGFYVMYYMLALVLSVVFSRRLVLYNRLSQFLCFSGVFLLKFVFMYYTLTMTESNILFSDYFIAVFPTILTTSLVAVPLFWVLSRFDELFAFYPHREKVTEVVF